ncbi:MFS transporter [Phytoactinopolyspora mesophila]|uniref:MFS transporter n=1 Tax=Phytoactinopolyspora mesophila TaxID=2650750 RepID=A0A7K3M4H1_9ACTN|nr:MFS transporter [Phytoactinopolyspora mesophila]
MSDVPPPPREPADGDQYGHHGDGSPGRHGPGAGAGGARDHRIHDPSQVDPAGGRSRRIAGVSARAARKAAVGTARVTRAGAGRLHRAAEAKGAGQTGLARLIELNAFSAFADAMVMVALAGTLFFSVPSDEARGNVALYLALTMAPFAIVAPLIGPFLDRFAHGRRWAIGITAAARGFLAWIAADAVMDEGVWLYPAALGILVGQKAYAVTRAAAVPRLLPEGITLVAANSRMQLAATFGTAVGAPVGLGLAQIGDDWPLRAAFFAYVGTTIFAVLLSKKVDSEAAEARVQQLRQKKSGRRFRVKGTVVRALRGNAGLRFFSGFMIMFFAFVLREEPVGGMDGLVLLGIVAASAWVGSAAGTSFGALVRSRSPDAAILVLGGMAAVVAAIGAVSWNLVTVIAAAIMGGFGQQLGRLSLDAIIQRDVPDRMRSNAFARSETSLQLAWVLGGGVGILLPLVPALGMAIAAAVLAGSVFWAVQVKPRANQGSPSAPTPPPDNRAGG